MNYDAILNSTYNWMSIEKLIWFLLFFWIALPVFLLVPIGIEQSVFIEDRLWFVNFLYSLIYFSLIIAFLTLTYYCLRNKNFEAKELSITKVFDGILLVFTQFWFVFIWNIHKSYRFTQLLLLFGLPLLWFYSIYLSNWFIEYALYIFILAYFAIVIYNYVRLSFSLTYFFSSDSKIKDAIKESWHMTHNKFWKTFFAYLVIFVAVLVLFIFYVLVLGAIISLILLNYFIAPIAYSLTFFIASMIAIGPVIISYYFAYFELYEQLILHKKSNISIKKILANKILINEARKSIIKTKKKVNKKITKKITKKPKKKIIKKKK